jgi:hypothetical protein
MKLLCIISSLAWLGARALDQQPAGRRAGLAMVLQFSYAGVKADLIAQADKMPEAHYGFRPGTMPDVRTFAEVMMHVADGQHDVCASIKGVPSPAAQRRSEATPTAKADVVRALADSFAFCDDVFAATTDENALGFVRQGPNELTRASVLYGLLAHSAEMYGIGTVYLRLNGIVPPSTERQRSKGATGG